MRPELLYQVPKVVPLGVLCEIILVGIGFGMADTYRNELVEWIEVCGCSKPRNGRNYRWDFA